MRTPAAITTVTLLTLLAAAGAQPSSEQRVRKIRAAFHQPQDPEVELELLLELQDIDTSRSRRLLGESLANVTDARIALGYWAAQATVDAGLRDRLLAYALLSPSPWSRIEAARLLRRVEDKDRRKRIVRILDETLKRGKLLRTTIWEVGNVGTPQEADKMSKHLSRLAAGTALGVLNWDEATSVLLQRLRAKDEWTRRAAVLGCRHLVTPDHYPLLMERYSKETVLDLRLEMLFALANPPAAMGNQYPHDDVLAWVEGLPTDGLTGVAIERFRSSLLECERAAAGGAATSRETTEVVDQRPLPSLEWDAEVHIICVGGGRPMWRRNVESVLAEHGGYELVRWSVTCVVYGDPPAVGLWAQTLPLTADRSRINSFLGNAKKRPRKLIRYRQQLSPFVHLAGRMPSDPLSPSLRSIRFFTTIYPITGNQPGLIELAEVMHDKDGTRIDIDHGRPGGKPPLDYLLTTNRHWRAFLELLTSTTGGAVEWRHFPQ